MSKKYEIRSTKFEVRSTKLEVRGTKYKLFTSACSYKYLKFVPIGHMSCVLLLTFFLSSCHVYSFKDVSIPPEIKTVKIGFIENRARYVNPQISPRLKDRLEQKIIGQTRLTRSNNDDAHYQISGYISDYSVSTAGISNQQAAISRLTVSVHITLKNTLANKVDEYDVSRNFDFSARLTLNQAEGALTEDIIRNLADEIFNRIFSNW